MDKKKYFGVLSSAALGVLLAFGLTTNAHAAVNGYVLKDAGDASKVVSFDKTALLNDYQNNVLGDPSPMFDSYMKDAAIKENFVAFNDSLKGLVSYDAVMSAYQDALLDDKYFSVDNFTETAKDANLVKDVTVGYICNQDGSIVLVSHGTPTVAIEKADTSAAGKTTIEASLPPQGVDPTKYDVTVNGTKLTYDSTTGKFTGTLDGTYTIQQLQGKTTVSLSGNSNSGGDNTSDGFDVSDIY